MSTSISFPIPAPGIWTITGQFAGQTVTQQINITDKDSTTPVVLTFSFSTITVTSPVGTALLLTDGTNQLTAVSTGTNTFTIYKMGQWTVSGTLEGYTLNSVTVNVAAGQDYPVQLSIQTATLTVTAPAGTVVSVTGNGDTQEITAASGTAVFQLTSFGSYQVSGVLNGLSTNTVTVDVTAYQTYTATLTIEAATIVVTTLDDVLVTAQNGNITLTDTAVNGQATFQTQTFGTWTIGGTLTGYTFAPQTVNVQAYQQYDVSLEPLVATITVTAPNGTEVTAETSTGEKVQGHVSNGTAVLNIYSLDTWTVSGVQNGLVTNTVPVQVTDWTNYPVTLTIWAATITVTTPTGTLVTAQNGATQVQGTASNDQVILAVQLTGDWIVSAQFDDQTDSETVNIQAEENYPIRLWVPTIVPTVVTGSVVTCTQGETVLTKASQSGKVKFYVPALGEWTLNATLNQQSSNMVIVDVQEDRDYPLLLSYTFATITVSTVAGTEITAQNGDIIITQTADSNGEAVFEVATFGTWTVSADFDGELVSAEVQVSEAINYDVEIVPPPAEVHYYGQLSPLTVGRQSLSAASVNGNLLFGGGQYTNPYVQYAQNVDVYSPALVHSGADPLSQPKSGLAATSLGNYALFGGGTSGGGVYSGSVEVYDSSLTHTVAQSGIMGGINLAATSNGVYALFGGGLQGTSLYFSSVYAYDETLTRINVESLSRGRYGLSAASTGEYMLFAGGQYGSLAYMGVDVYDSSLTRIKQPNLSTSKYYMGATSIGGYALFGGGALKNGESNSVDVYDSSLSRITCTPLNAARYYLSGANTNRFALFGGGNPSGTVVDAYDMSLTHSIPEEMNVYRYNLAGGKAGEYALFGGGFNGSQALPDVEAYYD